MAIRLDVSGVDRTDKVTAYTPIRYVDSLNARSTLTVTFHDVVDGFSPEDGAEIVLWNGDVRVFGGMLLEPEESLMPGTDEVVYTCHASDYSGVCDHLLVARAYTDQTVGAIVRDIVDQDMSEEGIEPAGVEEGPLIRKAVFNWQTITQSFNELAELSGMSWWVDAYRVLHFRERTSITAPAALSGANAGTVRVRPDRQQYRNHQVLRAGAGLTDVRTETLRGDGTRKTFNVAFKIGTVPAITVNGAPQTVGIRQLDTGKQWYWNKGVTEINQDDAGTALATGDVLAVTYEGMFPIIISAARGHEIDARKAIEGGSGRYSAVEERANLETAVAATAAVEAILDRYGKIGRVLQCQTATTGFRPGQLVTCAFPDHGIVDETFLIESVSGANPPGLDEELWFDVRALSGDPYGGWQRYFRNLQRVGREFVINVNEVVVGLNALAETTRALDSVIAATAGAPESRIGVGRIGFSVIGVTP
jgi:hypothetical protein